MTNPIDNPDQIRAEDEVIALLKRTDVIASRELVGRLWKNGWEDSPPEESRHQIEEAIDEYFVNWLFKAVASDAEHPRFVRDFMPAYRWHDRDVPGARTGGDNPDNVYRLAGIAHGVRYRVTAKPAGKAAAHASFSLVSNFGTSVIIQTAEMQNFDREPDGSFVVTIDDQPANGRANHMATAPGVKFLFVRDSLEDWAGETPLDLKIERLDPPSRGPLTLDELADINAQRSREDVSLYFWFQFAWINIKLNTLTAPRTNRGTGGMLTQGLSKGHFRLAEDEAVILDYEPAGARYVSIQLCDWYYRALDAHLIQSSITRAQSKIDPDGRIRAVIARRDPGVANWLDTGGLEEVLTLQRWQGLPAEPVNGGIDVKMKIVKLDQLRAELPADTVWVSAEERARQIAERRAAFSRRVS